MNQNRDDVLGHAVELVLFGIVNEIVLLLSAGVALSVLVLKG